ncbi:MAG: DUF2934 domain-containing protein [Sulfuricaulis sp.]|nr:DUF2934 domain-containing protein [Sulfuricaulis sp.]
MNNPQDMDKKMDLMQEGMLKMHEQMHKIMDAKNPQERERLMQTQRELMRQHMQSMKEGGMMGGDAKSGPDTTKQIAKRAYALYEQHGHQIGHEKQDWLQAEREIRSSTTH